MWPRVFVQATRDVDQHAAMAGRHDPSVPPAEGVSPLSDMPMEIISHMIPFMIQSTGNVDAILSVAQANAGFRSMVAEYLHKGSFKTFARFTPRDIDRITDFFLSESMNNPAAKLAAYVSRYGTMENRADALIRSAQVDPEAERFLSNGTAEMFCTFGANDIDRFVAFFGGGVAARLHAYTRRFPVDIGAIWGRLLDTGSSEHGLLEHAYFRNKVKEFAAADRGSINTAARKGDIDTLRLLLKVERVNSQLAPFVGGVNVDRISAFLA